MTFVRHRRIIDRQAQVYLFTSLVLIKTDFSPVSINKAYVMGESVLVVCKGMIQMIP